MQSAEGKREIFKFISHWWHDGAAVYVVKVSHHSVTIQHWSGAQLILKRFIKTITILKLLDKNFITILIWGIMIHFPQHMQ